jgi:hypothetical protein
VLFNATAGLYRYYGFIIAYSKLGSFKVSLEILVFYSIRMNLWSYHKAWTPQEFSREFLVCEKVDETDFPSTCEESERKADALSAPASYFGAPGLQRPDTITEILLISSASSRH